MTLTNCYITMDDIRGRAGIPDHADDSTLEPAITSACRAIDKHVGFPFFDVGSATARDFVPCDEYVLRVADFSTTTGLVVKTDTGYDGTFATTWAAADYELLPLSGWNYDSRPYNTIRSIRGQLFPLPYFGSRAGLVQVTARWGWTAPPQNVVEASKILAIDLWKRKDVPFGITTGTVDFGGLRIGHDLMAQVASLLRPFRPAMVA